MIKPAVPCILTFDLGTTRLKAALFSRRGRLLAQESARHVDHHAGELHWQDADAWWADAVRLAKLLLGKRRVDVQAISLSGRAGAAVFIARDGTVMAQPWSDRRHHEQLRRLREALPELPAYAAALLAKKMWFVDQHPHAARGLQHVLYAKDFLLFRLTQRAVTDWSSGPDADHWHQPALEFSHTSGGLLPHPALPWSIGGVLAPMAARSLGLPAGVPVAVGAHDGVAANLGAGAASIGAYAITIGTHAVVRAITATVPDGGYRFYGLPPDRHVIGGNGLMAGRAADWLLDLSFGAADQQRQRHFKQTERAAAQLPVGAAGVRFLPYLAGSVAPQRRPGAQGAFTGLRVTHGRDALYRAVLEGSACAIADIFRQIMTWCGPPTVIRLTGGGARSALWCTALSNLIGLPLQGSDSAVEGRGAALCAAVALGWHDDVETAAEAMVPIRTHYQPEPERADEYRALYDDWRRANTTLKTLDQSPD